MSRRFAKAACALLLALVGVQVAMASPSAAPLESRQYSRGQFRNPLNNGADPTVVYYKGNYYLSTTGGDHFSIWKSPSLSTLAAVDPVEIWRDTEATRNTELWAPALHKFEVDGKLHWYLYYTAADSTVPSDQRDSTHRLYVLESEGDDPLGPYKFKAQIADTG